MTLRAVARSYQLQLFASKKLFQRRLDTKTLNSLKTSDEQLEYLTNLDYQLSDRGSGRAVFLLSSKKVIKIAMNDSGITQNEVEYSVLSGKKSNFLPKLYNFAPDFRWLEVELVRPLTSERELSQLLGGVSVYDYNTIIRLLHAGFNSLTEIIDDQIRFLKVYQVHDFIPEDFEAKIKKWEHYRHNSILNQLAEDIVKNKIPVRDLETLANLGKNSDGHLVFLDVGFR